MTKTFNDYKRDYFKSQQTIFSTEKQTYDYERAALSEALLKPINTTSIPSDWRAYFASEGLDSTKNLSDLWYTWLGSKGFTQAHLRERLLAFYKDGSVNL